MNIILYHKILKVIIVVLLCLYSGISLIQRDVLAEVNRNLISVELTDGLFNLMPDHPFNIKTLENYQGRLDDNDKSKDFILLPLTFYQSGYQSQAISILHNECISATSACNVVSQYWLGKFYLEIGENYNTLTIWKTNGYLDKAIALARELFVKGDFNQSKTIYEELLRVDSLSAQLWFEYGRVSWFLYFQKLNGPENIEDESIAETIRNAFSRASELDPNNQEYLSWLGWYFYTIKNDPKLALDYLNRAAALNNTDDPWIFYRLGRVYVDLGNFSAALNSYQEANTLSDGPNFVITKPLSKVLFKLGKIDEAIQMMKITIEQQPHLAENHYLLALFYAKKCDFNMAELEYDKGNEMDRSGDFFEIRGMLKSIFESGKDCDDN